MASPHELVGRPSFAQADNELLQTFPLRLSPFEKFVLWDERPRQPLTGYVELRFSTPLDAARLETALHEAVHRNPLLACRLREHAGDLWWDYDPEYRPRLLCPRRESPLSQGWPREIDLRRECGGRYWFGAHEEGWRWMIQFHHACCDGVGMRQIVIDTLAGYTRLLGTSGNSQLPTAVAADKISRLERLSVTALRDRFDFSRTYHGAPKRPLTFWQRLKNAHYFHFRLPTPLRGSAQAADALATDAAQEPLRYASINRELSQQILDTARRQQIKINDLALALLFQTCVGWNRQQGDSNPKSHIRILMPYDLRSRADLQMPATNRLSFSFLGRDVRQCEDFSQLLASVQTEVQAIKDSRLPLDFLEALDLAHRSPKAMRWVINHSRRMATVVLTYTGDLSRGLQRYFPERDGVKIVGDTQVTHVYAAPPVREHTNITIGLCVNWGQLSFCAAWNRAVLTPSECEQFLQQYVDAWQAWLSAEPR